MLFGKVGLRDLRLIKITSMKTLLSFSVVLLLCAACTLTNQGIQIGLPTVNTVCLDPVDNSEVADIKSRIVQESFKSDRLERARYVTKNKCFTVSQVIDIISVFDFEDNNVALAKDLYHQVNNPQDYDLVVDSLVYGSNKDELRAYINAQA